MYGFDFAIDPDQYRYTFVTKNSHQYTVLFSKLTDVSNSPWADHLYTLTLGSASDKCVFDPYTSQTIYEIISHFYAQKLNLAILCYYPDNDDDREYKRVIAFNRWFTNCPFAHEYEKQEYWITTPEEQYKTTFILHSSNPETQSIFSEIGNNMKKISKLAANI